MLDQLSQLQPNQIHHDPDSNAWAANGPAVAGGGALLGGDPHLPQTLPSIWYEVALSAPGYQAAGVTVPGVPGILLGHNDAHRLVADRHAELGDVLLRRAGPRLAVLLARRGGGR